MTTKTYYVTKYALSRGIFKQVLTLDDEGYATRGETGGYSYYKIGRDCFESRDEAIQDAKFRAVAKLKSLDRQRTKLEALAYEPKWDGSVKSTSR
jgi:hypothetical protein